MRWKFWLHFKENLNELLPHFWWWRSNHGWIRFSWKRSCICHPFILLMESFRKKSEVRKSLCQDYSLRCLSHKVSHSSWQLVSTKNLGGEILPPTLAALLSNLILTNYISTSGKSYTTATAAMPRLEDNGWSYDGVFFSVKCLPCPALSAAIEAVKSGSKGACKGNCLCA